MNAESIPAGLVQRVVIVHGYKSAPDANWFPWLQRELQSAGVDVSFVPLPAPNDAETTAWENAEDGVTRSRQCLT
ncbi:hypothetical protein ACFFGR_17040 [Arthrobacter liuii]|uniref:Esterase n=1 Tax=Arthrobacter liuii TaxID=1476996 RepID=A0ABQ2B157_9MICC|nr:hypothetical protein [Arthrobacter liuii]GGI02358.1 hypothetical protein GCM10007170_43920 [Arthrobacter liuii]